MMIVDAPCPQPMSATLAPRSSFSWTPSSAGIHSADEVGAVARPEEPLGAAEQALVVLVPAHPLRRCGTPR